MRYFICDLRRAIGENNDVILIEDNRINLPFFNDQDHPFKPIEVQGDTIHACWRFTIEDTVTTKIFVFPTEDRLGNTNHRDWIQTIVHALGVDIQEGDEFVFFLHDADFYNTYQRFQGNQHYRVQFEHNNLQCDAKLFLFQHRTTDLFYKQLGGDNFDWNTSWANIKGFVQWN